MIFAGFNHVMHQMEPPNEYLINRDDSTTKIGDKGGDTTDYVYEPESMGSLRKALYFYESADFEQINI